MVRALLVVLAVVLLACDVEPSSYDIGSLSCRQLAGIAERRLSDLDNVKAIAQSVSVGKRLTCSAWADIDGERVKVIIYIFDNRDGSQKLGYRN